MDGDTMIVFFYMILALIVGVFFLQILGWWILNKKESRADELESEFTTARMGRNAQIINLIYKIGKPDMNGQYSTEKMELWNQLQKMEVLDAGLTDQEINQVFKAWGWV